MRFKFLNYLVILIALFTIAFLSVPKTLAAAKDTNTNNIYCDNGKTIKKTCTSNAQVEACYSLPGVDCNTQPIWDCIYEKISERCENQQTQNANEPINKVFGQITPPDAVSKIGIGAAGISTFLSNSITLLYVVATIAVVFMVVWGAFEWIVSGGEKEKVASARKRITYALIGLVLLSLSFLILKVVGDITNLKLFAGA